MKRFLLGFAIGATASAAIVLATTPRSGTENRQQIANTYTYARQRITEKVQTALTEGRSAAMAREQELWSEFYRRVENDRPEDE